MKRIAPIRYLAAIAGVMLSVTPDVTMADDAVNDSWQITLAPYAWALGITGDVGVGGLSAEVDDSFLDILDASDSLMAFQGHVEAQRGRFGLFVDGSYADIQASYDGKFITLDVDQTLALIEGGGFYRVIDDVALLESSEQTRNQLSADILVGVRYTSLTLKLEASEIFGSGFKKDFEGSRDWVDPFVGARVLLNLADPVDLVLRGDVGGFGVGSDFTWNTQALLGYRFTLFGKEAEGWAGYRALSQDYAEGCCRDRFEWDVIMHGPTIGMTVKW